jgi:hypothetical protein
MKNDKDLLCGRLEGKGNSCMVLVGKLVEMRLIEISLSR